MKPARLKADSGHRSRNLVLSQILRQPGISRTRIGQDVGLNAASVSRISRDLIGAGLVRETDRFGPKDRPGRRFVGLAPRGEGGFVVGIGINAFRQSVTLADLENRRIAEWTSPQAPGPDGQGFIRACLEVAAGMVDAHVADRRRFFGVGMAVAADINRDKGEIVNAPVFGWSDAIAAAELARAILDAPLVLDTPSSAINLAEADHGSCQGVANLMTLYCSLGFGIGIRRVGDGAGPAHELGCVLSQSQAPDGSGRKMSEAFGGQSILAEAFGEDSVAGRSGVELGTMLIDAIVRSHSDPRLAMILRDRGARTANALSLILDICRPECILLGGPLAGAPAFADSFAQALPQNVNRPNGVPEIKHTSMTPVDASLWLALRRNVVEADFALEAIGP